jgi:hypothetical protein
VALGDQRITEVRTDKTGSTGDENAHRGESIGASDDLSRLPLGWDLDNSKGKAVVLGELGQRFRKAR